MGYTVFSKKRIRNLINLYNPKSVIDLGAQNDFEQPNLPAPYISDWYLDLGIRYMCIDLNKENGAYAIDLSKPLPKDFAKYIETLSNGDPFLFSRIADMIVDCGTSEHVGTEGKFSWEAIYNCWETKHELLAIGGIMYSENPKTGNWPGHGFNYYTEGFYDIFCKISGYGLIELGEHPACNNTTDGWNIFCSMQKITNEFPTFKEFKKLDLKQK